MKKSILLAAGVLAAFGLSLSAFAAAPKVPEPIVADPNAVILPQVSVREITTDKTAYDAGDTVKGTFLIANTGTIQASDIYYRTSLNGGYAGGMAAVTYDSATAGPVTLRVGEKQQIAFSYVLPAAFSGNLSIRVRAYLRDALGLGWSDKAIKVNPGTLTSAALTKASVVAEGKEFDLTSGPTVKSSVSLSVSFKNDGKAIPVIPNIVMHKRADSVSPAFSMTSARIFITPGKSSFSIPLPISALDGPGVYFGTASFLDSSGVLRAPSIDFQYIIGGDIATLNSISSDKTTASAGETVTVSLTYSGTPYDIVTAYSAPIDGAHLSVVLKNQSGVTVASYDKPQDFNDDGKITIPFVLSADASSLRVEAQALKGNKILSSLTTEFIPPPAPKTDWLTMIKTNPAADILGGFIILALGAFVYELWRAKNKRAMKSLLILCILSGAFVAGAHPAKADFVQVDSGCVVKDRKTKEDVLVPLGTDAIRTTPGCHPPAKHSFIPVVSAINITDDDTGAAVDENTVITGENIDIGGTVTSWACSNKQEDISYQLTDWDGNVYDTDPSHFTIKGKHWRQNGADFSGLGPVTAPDTPGDYTLELRVNTVVGYRLDDDLKNPIELHRGYLIIDQNIHVVPPHRIGYLDGANCSVISGWACAPANTTPADPNAPVDVYFYDRDQKDPTSTTGDLLIGDVMASSTAADSAAIAAACGPGDRGAHRFFYTLDGDLTDGKPHDIYALPEDDPTQPLGIDGPVTMDGLPGHLPICSPPIGVIDSAGCNNISGWACDPLNSTASTLVDFYAVAKGSTPNPDDEKTNFYVDQVVASNPSEADVNNACNGGTNHRYFFDISNGLSGAGPNEASLNDSNKYTIYAVDDATGIILAYNGVSQQKTIQCFPPTGGIDSASCTTISGWACDPNDSATSTVVDLYAQVGNKPDYFADNPKDIPIDIVTASQSKPSIASVCGTANHGFTYTYDATDAGVDTGKVMRVYAVNDDTQELIGDAVPKTIQCFPPDVCPNLTADNTIVDGQKGPWSDIPDGYYDPGVTGNCIPTPPIIGYLNKASCSMFTGWACDPTTASSTEVFFYDSTQKNPDGSDVQVGDPVMANLPVTDTIDADNIALQCKNTAPHAFSVSASQISDFGLVDGLTHSIYALPEDDPTRVLKEKGSPPDPKDFTFTCAVECPVVDGIQEYLDPRVSTSTGLTSYDCQKPYQCEDLNAANPAPVPPYILDPREVALVTPKYIPGTQTATSLGIPTFALDATSADCVRPYSCPANTVLPDGISPYDATSTDCLSVGQCPVVDTVQEFMNPTDCVTKAQCLLNDDNPADCEFPPQTSECDYPNTFPNPLDCVSELVCPSGSHIDPPGTSPYMESPDPTSMCVCNNPTWEVDTYGVCRPPVDQCQNLTQQVKQTGVPIKDASGKPFYGPFYDIPDGYYQPDENVMSCALQVDCTPADAQCDFSQCNDSTGYRTLDDTSCVFPSACKSDSIQSLKDQVNTGDPISCDTPEGDEVFPSDVSFNGVPGSGGQCTLSWKVAPNKADSAPPVCVVSGPADIKPVTLSGLNNTVKLKSSGSRYTISCKRSTKHGPQLLPAIKVTQCKAEVSPIQREI